MFRVTKVKITVTVRIRVRVKVRVGVTYTPREFSDDECPHIAHGLQAGERVP